MESTNITNYSIEVTQNALDRLKFLATKEPEGSFFRVSVESGGCSGFQYKFAFDKILGDDDIIIKENQNIRVVVDSISIAFLANSTVDFVEDITSSAFEIKNPNANSSCGCGTSFSV